MGHPSAEEPSRRPRRLPGSERELFELTEETAAAKIAPNAADADLDYPVYREMRQIGISNRGNRLFSLIQINRTARAAYQTFKEIK